VFWVIKNTQLRNVRGGPKATSLFLSMTWVGHGVLSNNKEVEGMTVFSVTCVVGNDYRAYYTLNLDNHCAEVKYVFPQYFSRSREVVEHTMPVLAAQRELNRDLEVGGVVTNITIT
jgi:hypothetical protein